MSANRAPPTGSSHFSSKLEGFHLLYSCSSCDTLRVAALAIWCDPHARKMVVAYVNIQSNLSGPSTGRVKALLLPDENGKWDETCCVPSPYCGGFGVAPSFGHGVLWDDMKIPVVLPYFGMVGLGTRSAAVLVLVLVGMRP